MLVVEAVTGGAVLAAAGTEKKRKSWSAEIQKEKGSGAVFSSNSVFFLKKYF